MNEVRIADSIVVGGANPLLVIAGPCVIESEETCLQVAHSIQQICAAVGLPCVFKASFDKANRTSISSYRGPGLEKGLAILRSVKEKTGIAVLSDVHEPSQATPAAEVLDVLQVPAFLCRQTDLLVACADTGLPVNIKKGQFMDPAAMEHAARKVLSRGNSRILLCERGSCFGYNDLVVDMRSIPRMKALGYPVIFDATHSVQAPAGLGEKSGGDWRMAPTLAAAAVAAGADGVFLETHPDPSSALSDAATMLPLEEVEPLLKKLRAISALVGKG